MDIYTIWVKMRDLMAVAIGPHELGDDIRMCASTKHRLIETLLFKPLVVYLRDLWGQSL